MSEDYNSQPQEITYRLLLGVPLTAGDYADLMRSTVIHQSVDLLHDPNWTPPPQSEAQLNAKHHSVRSGQTITADEDDEDKVIKNCRAATTADGLASLEELQQLYAAATETGPIRSAYGEIGGRFASEEGKWYVDRLGEAQGANDPVLDAERLAQAIKARKESGSMEERVRRGDFEPMWTNCGYSWDLFRYTKAN